MTRTPPNKDMGLFLALTPVMIFLTAAPLFIFCTTTAMKVQKGSVMFWVLSGLDLLLFSLFAFSVLILLPVGIKMISGQLFQVAEGSNVTVSVKEDLSVHQPVKRPRGRPRKVKEE